MRLWKSPVSLLMRWVTTTIAAAASTAAAAASRARDDRDRPPEAWDLPRARRAPLAAAGRYRARDAGGARLARLLPAERAPPFMVG